MSLSLAPFPCRLRVRGRMPCLQCQRCRLHEEGECEGPALRSLRSLCTGGRSELSIFCISRRFPSRKKKKHSKKLLNVGSQAAHVAIMSQLTRRGVFSWFMDLLGGRYRIEHKWAKSTRSQLVGLTDSLARLREFTERDDGNNSIIRIQNPGACPDPGGPAVP